MCEVPASMNRVEDPGDYEDHYPELSTTELNAIDCATECVCGAWVWSPDNKPVHIADCICGCG